MSGDKARSTFTGELCVFSVMLNVGEGNGVPPPVLNTDQGVKQTRKGEDIVASTSLVLKGRCECIRGVHTKMPNTDRPPVG